MRTTTTGTACAIIASTVLAVFSAPVHAQSDAAKARDLASTCANCHGTGGKAAQGAVPALAGQSKADLVLKMNEFRDGKRTATIMHQLAKGYTPEQIDLIAGWFAQQKP